MDSLRCPRSCGLSPRSTARRWVSDAEYFKQCSWELPDSCTLLFPFPLQQNTQKLPSKPTQLSTFFLRFSFPQLCSEFCNVLESGPCGYTANSYASLEAARSQLRGRGMWTTLSGHVCSGFGFLGLILSSSHLQRVTYGDCRLVGVISTPGEMSVYNEEEGLWVHDSCFATLLWSGADKQVSEGEPEDISRHSKKPTQEPKADKG